MKVVFFFGDKALTSIEYMFCRWSEALVAKGNRVEIVVPHQVKMSNYFDRQIKIRRSFGTEKIMVQGDVYFAATEESLQRCQGLPGISFLVWNQYSLPREYHDGRIVCFSTCVKDYFLEHHGKEIHYIPPVADRRIFDHFFLEEEELPGLNLLFWGDEGSGDDLHTTLAALDLIKSSLPRLKLYVLGTPLPKGTTFPEAEEITYPVDLNGRLNLLGGVRIVLWSRRADAVALNVAALEVIAANKPLVCFTCQGIEDFAQPGENCLLIEPAENAKHVAMDILRILRIGQVRNNIIANARQYVKGLEAEAAGREINGLALRSLDLGGKEKEWARPTGKEGHVDLVIVGCDNLKRLKKCVDTIKEHTLQPYNMIIVGNASVDGSKEYIDSLAGVTGIFTQGKGDYSKACNRAMLTGDGEYIVFLNCEVEVGADWLAGMLECARGDDKVAVVGPQLVTGDNLIIDACVTELDEICGPRRRPVPNEMGAFEEAEEVIDVSGACYLIKRNLLTKLGLFDENCPPPLATTDYSLRAQEKAYRVMYCPQSRVLYRDEDNADQAVGELPVNELADGRRYFRDKWSSLQGGKEKRKLAKDILVLGKTPWEYYPQRAQELLTRFAGKGYNILYVNPYCSPAGLSRVNGKLHVYSPPGNGTAKLNMQYADNRCKMALAINETLASLAVNYPILWVDAPFWQPLVKHFEHSVLIYDCPNASCGFVGSDKDCFWAEEKSVLLDNADCVFVPREKFLADKDTGNIYLMPNGVDNKIFNHCPGKILLPPQELAKLEPPIILYYGPITYRFDMDLVAKLAANLEKGSIVLIGTVSGDIAPLKDLPRIHFLGERNYTELPRFLQESHVCIIPGKKNILRDDAVPSEIYAYLAAGKPVVSVRLPELERFKDDIVFADGEEFIAAVLNFIENKPRGLAREAGERLVERVRGEDWSCRVEAIEELFYKSYGEEYKPDKDFRDAGTCDDGEGALAGNGISIKEEKEALWRQTFFSRCCSWFKSLFRGI